MTTSPSGVQYDIRHGRQHATIVEVGVGIRTDTVGDWPGLNGYRRDQMCDGARGTPLIPWPNRLAGGHYRFHGGAAPAPADRTRGAQHHPRPDPLDQLAPTRPVRPARRARIRPATPTRLPLHPAPAHQLRTRHRWSVRLPRETTQGASSGMLWRHPDVYGDISAYFPKTLDPELVRAMDRQLRGKLMIGFIGLGLSAAWTSSASSGRGTRPWSGRYGSTPWSSGAADSFPPGSEEGGAP